MIECNNRFAKLSLKYPFDGIRINAYEARGTDPRSLSSVGNDFRPGELINHVRVLPVGQSLIGTEYISKEWRYFVALKECRSVWIVNVTTLLNLSSSYLLSEICASTLCASFDSGWNQTKTSHDSDFCLVRENIISEVTVGYFSTR